MGEATATMKALRYYGRRDIRVEPIDKPKLPAKHVLVQVEWCGICGSDLHEYSDGPFACPVAAPHPLTGDSSPVVMGHEFCGRVVDVSTDSKHEVGTAVMVDPRYWCGSCLPCRSGATNVCKMFGFKGLSGGGGGLSELAAVHEDNAYPVYAEKLHLAALIEPLAVAWHGVSRAGTDSLSGPPVLVLGGGPIGLAVCIVLRARGAETICVSEPAKIRRELAASYADIVLDPIAESVSKRLDSLTNGDGIKLVIDCAGVQPGMEEGLQALRLRGTYLNLAGWTRPWHLRQELVTCKELMFTSSMSYTSDDFKSTVDSFNSGKFQGLEKLVTSRIFIDDVETRGFKKLIETPENEVKIMVTTRKSLLEKA